MAADATTHIGLVRQEFQAMGGVVEVQVPATAAARIDDVVDLFAAHEQRMSRFLEWSELTQLNRAAPRPIPVSPMLFDVIRQSLAFATGTEGAFDPTLLRALEGAGYDRTFDEVPATVLLAADGPPRAAGRWRDITLDTDARTIALPAGVAIDLGGIGKGYAVDRAIEALGVTAPALVNAAGDLRVTGRGPDGEGWRIGVEDPFDHATAIAVLAVSDAAVATSGSYRRAWRTDGGARHHLIHPRTMTSASSDLVSVTVVAPTATEADVYAKALLLGGAQRLVPTAARFGIETLAVTHDRRILRTPGTPLLEPVA